MIAVCFTLCLHCLFSVHRYNIVLTFWFDFNLLPNKIHSKFLVNRKTKTEYIVTCYLNEQWQKLQTSRDKNLHHQLFFLMFFISCVIFICKHTAWSKGQTDLWTLTHPVRIREDKWRSEMLKVTLRCFCYLRCDEWERDGGPRFWGRGTGECHQLTLMKENSG